MTSKEDEQKAKDFMRASLIVEADRNKYGPWTLAQAKTMAHRFPTPLHKSFQQTCAYAEALEQENTKLQSEIIDWQRSESVLIVESSKLRAEASKLKDRVAKLETCHMVLEHAIELGYLGEGSTASMAREALRRCEEES